MEKAPEFPTIPVWKPLEMAFILEKTGLVKLAPAYNPDLQTRVTDLLRSAGLDDPQLIYTFTHLVFFSTGFGLRPKPPQLRKAWRELTLDALDRCCENDHLDLVAELLTVTALLHLRDPNAIFRGWNKLAEAQAEDGAIRQSQPPGTYLAEYHKCLVTVIAAQTALCGNCPAKPRPT